MKFGVITGRGFTTSVVVFPFELVYVPPSFEKDVEGSLTGPLIYKVNKDYNPNE